MKIPILFALVVTVFSGCTSPSPWKEPPLHHAQERYRSVFEEQAGKNITIEGVIWVETKGPCGICVVTLDGVLFSLRGEAADAMLHDSGRAVVISGALKKATHWPSGGLVQEIPEPFSLYYIEINDVRTLTRFSTPPRQYGLQ